MIGLFVILSLLQSRGSTHLSFCPFHQETHNLKLNHSRSIAKKELRPSLCFVFENITLNNMSALGPCLKVSLFIFPCGTCIRYSRTQYKLNCSVHPHSQLCMVLFSVLFHICHTEGILVH